MVLHEKCGRKFKESHIGGFKVVLGFLRSLDRRTNIILNKGLIRSVFANFRIATFDLVVNLTRP